MALDEFINLERASTLLDQESKNGYYLSYPIEKSSGGRRWLDAPQGDLKDLQYEVLYNILYHFTPHPCAIGFRTGTGMIEGPKRHLGAEVLLNLDFKDFFPSIKKGRMLKLITWMADQLQLDGLCNVWPRTHIELLSELVTYKGHLPQGAPTSPSLSNLALLQFDENVKKICDLHDVTYTRYADDMSFSSEDKDKDIMEIMPSIREEIRDENLELNYDKTRIQRQHQRMMVTGVVVNDKLSVPKWKWRNFRAKLHNLKMSQDPVGPAHYQRILGYAQWIKQLHPKRGDRFLKEINKLNLQL